jgi:hypothetical protein
MAPLAVDLAAIHQELTRHGGAQEKDFAVQAQHAPVASPDCARIAQ